MYKKGDPIRKLSAGLLHIFQGGKFVEREFQRGQGTGITVKTDFLRHGVL